MLKHEKDQCLTQTVWRRTMSWHIWHTRFLEGLVSAYQFQGICSNLILQLFGTLQNLRICPSPLFGHPVPSVLWSWFLWGPNPTNRRTRCRWHNGGILLDRWHLRGHHSLRRPGDVVIWEGRRLLLLLCQVFFDPCKYVTYSYLYYDWISMIWNMATCNTAKLAKCKHDHVVSSKS